MYYLTVYLWYACTGEESFGTGSDHIRCTTRVSFSAAGLPSLRLSTGHGIVDEI